MDPRLAAFIEAMEAFKAYLAEQGCTFKYISVGQPPDGESYTMGVFDKWGVYRTTSHDKDIAALTQRLALLSSTPHRPPPIPQRQLAERASVALASLPTFLPDIEIEL